MKYYKVLKADGTCCNGGKGKWYLPEKLADGTWKPGRWMPEIEGKLIPCERGYHICRPDDLVYWLDETIYEVEYEGKIVEDDNKCVVRRARLLRRVETWTERTARLFAADCAEHILHIFETEYPDDDRPRNAIQAARDYANGLITESELEEMWYASWYASAAEYAAASAAWSARSAACSAEYAACSAARSAARSAAWYAERSWQTEKLFEYLEGSRRRCNLFEEK